MKNKNCGSFTWTRVFRCRWILFCIGVLLAFSLLVQAVPKHKGGFSGPRLSADGDLLAVANPDNNTVTFFDTSRPVPEQIDEVRVGREPNGVAQFLALPDTDGFDLTQEVFV